jgi:hypothetical protein
LGATALASNLLGIDTDLVDPQSSQELIIKTCVEEWFKQGPNGLRNYGDCSGFLKSVQTALRLKPFDGRANAIFNELDIRPDWQVLGTGSNAVSTAGSAANAGFFTIGVFKNPDPKKDGHVAIITAFLTLLGRKPEHHAIGAWGAHNSVGQIFEKMSFSFRADQHRSIKYAKCIYRPLVIS